MRVTVQQIGMFSSGAFSFDEIRVGEDFADVTPVPEPSIFILLAMGALGLLVSGRRRRRG